MNADLELGKQVLVWTRQPKSEAEQMGLGRILHEPIAGGLHTLCVYECFENDAFLQSQRHRAEVANAICEELTRWPEDTQVYVLFHGFVKKRDREFVHAQLGLIDELLPCLPGRLHLAVLGGAHDVELRRTMDEVLSEKRAACADSEQYPLLELSLDQLGWAEVEQLQRQACQSSPKTN